MAFRSEARENGIDYQPVVAGTTNSKVFFRHWLTLDLRIRFIKIGDIPEGTLVVPEVAAADFILRDFSSDHHRQYCWAQPQSREFTESSATPGTLR